MASAEEILQNQGQIIDEKEKQSSDSDDHDHDHDHEHGHSHDHKYDEHGHDDQDDDKKGGKANRGEKKFKKAMTKLGMKPVTGINRVTIKKSKALLLYIDNPEILKSPGTDNSYIIFGEAKIHDTASLLANQEADKLKRAEKPDKIEAPTTKTTTNQAQPTEVQPATTTETQPEEDEGPLNEDGLEKETIELVISSASCTRNQAIRALRESKGDSVDAIIALSGNK